MINLLKIVEYKNYELHRKAPCLPHNFLVKIETAYNARWLTKCSLLYIYNERYVYVYIYIYIYKC